MFTVNYVKVIVACLSCNCIAGMFVNTLLARVAMSLHVPSHLHSLTLSSTLTHSLHKFVLRCVRVCVCALMYMCIHVNMCVQSVYPVNKLRTYAMTLIPFAVDRYLKKVSHERSGLHSHRRTPNPKSRPREDHMLSSDTDTSEVHSGHMQPVYVKQSSLPHDVERDNWKKRGTSMLPRQMSEDGTYRSRPKAQHAVGSEYVSDSDSSLSSSDWDRVPVATAVTPRSRSRGSHHKSQSRKLPNALSVLTAQEASMYAVNDYAVWRSDRSSV